MPSHARHGRTRVLTVAGVALCSLAVVNATLASPSSASATPSESYTYRQTVTTPRLDLRHATTFTRVGPYGNNICETKVDFHWDLQGARTAREESRTDRAIRGAIKGIRFPGVQDPYLDKEDNTAHVYHALSAATNACPDWIRNDFHRRLVSGTALEAKARTLEAFVGLGAASVVILLLGTYAWSPAVWAFAGCVGGVVGEAFYRYYTGKGWEKYVRDATIACFVGGISGVVLGKIAGAFEAVDMASTTASLSEQGTELETVDELSSLGEDVTDVASRSISSLSDNA